MVASSLFASAAARVLLLLLFTITIIIIAICGRERGSRKYITQNACSYPQGDRFIREKRDPYNNNNENIHPWYIAYIRSTRCVSGGESRPRTLSRCQFGSAGGHCGAPTYFNTI